MENKLIITITINNYLHTIDLQDIVKLPHINQLELLNKLDSLMIDTNKSKYENSQKIITYIESIRSPNYIDRSKITLLALLNFFQKQYVSQTFKAKLNRIPAEIRHALPYTKIDIISKLNNLPHLIGISGIRDTSGNVISRAQPKEFLNGVLYQWIQLQAHETFTLDYEKLEVFPWIHQTLSTPTYIFLKEAINSSETNFDADIIFVRKILYSDKYTLHLVGLKNEHGNTFAFKSQFAISKERFYKFKKMFNIDKAIYDFYKEKKKVPR